ncbi:MAG TPA: class I SAM-dependent methyltransferase [Solirubrobacterales bacterium]|nr:class I SAM-dependent methyltransferase [Solirubrobacterales bacterium]
MAAPIDFVETSRAVADRLHDYRSRVNRLVAPDDAMFSGDLEGYLSVSDSAIAQIGHTMTICGRTSFGRILDLPSGHGRVMRGLHAAFPDAELTACDLDRGGVDFCATQFGAVPVYSDPDPARIPLDGDFDLIWVGSLLTHLDAGRCREFLDLFRTHLSEGGLLLFSSHGRNAVKRWPKDDERAQAIAEDFQRKGFGYRDHHGVQGYGTSAFTAAWITETLATWTDLMILAYVERGLADHQDLIAVLKMDVHHRQGDLLLV